MSFKLTDRDKKLLYWLGLFLIAFALWYLVIKPLQEKNAGLEGLIAAARQQSRDWVQKAEGLNSLRAAYSEEEALNRSLNVNFYENLSASRIDRLLTGLALKNRLRVNLFTTGISAKNSLAPYVYSDIYDSEAAEGQPLKGICISEVCLEVSGNKADIYKLVDSLGRLKAVRIKALVWWPYYYTDEESRYIYRHLYFDGEGQSALRLELELYMLDGVTRG